MSKRSNTSTSQPEWANYDFRTWDPGNVQAGPAATFTGAALRSLIASPDWGTNLAAGVSGLKQSVAPNLNAYAAALKQKLNSMDANLATATATAQQQILDVQDSLRATAAPPQPAADPAAYQVAAKVVDQKSKVGLPGITVRLFESQNPSVTLASGSTDLAGNVVLKLSREQMDASTGATKKSSIALEVLPTAGKAAFSTQLCPKLNQTETVLAGIESTPELSRRLSLANLVVAQKQKLLRTITAHADALKTQDAQTRSDLQQELQQVQAMIADLK